jgi:hypothetical protein
MEAELSISPQGILGALVLAGMPDKSSQPSRSETLSILPFLRNRVVTCIFPHSVQQLLPRPDC